MIQHLWVLPTVILEWEETKYDRAMVFPLETLNFLYLYILTTRNQLKCEQYSGIRFSKVMYGIKMYLIYKFLDLKQVQLE